MDTRPIALIGSQWLDAPLTARGASIFKTEKTAPGAVAMAAMRAINAGDAMGALIVGPLDSLQAGAAERLEAWLAMPAQTPIVVRVEFGAELDDELESHLVGLGVIEPLVNDDDDFEFEPGAAFDDEDDEPVESFDGEDDEMGVSFDDEDDEQLDSLFAPVEPIPAPAPPDTGLASLIARAQAKASNAPTIAQAVEAGFAVPPVGSHGMTQRDWAPPTPTVPGSRLTDSIESGYRLPPSATGLQHAPVRVALAKVIAVLSRKGGSAKTTTSLLLAQRAAEAGLRVLGIDGNFGQENWVTSLAIPQIRARRIDAAWDRSGRLDLANAVMTAAEITESRAAHMPQIKFDALFGPSDELIRHDPGRFSVGFVHEIVRQARTLYDLIVLDTQILDGLNPPIAAQAAVGMALGNDPFATLVLTVNTAAATLISCESTLEEWRSMGITRNRILVEQVMTSQNFEAQRVDLQALAHHASILPVTVYDEGFKAAIETGVIETAHPAVERATNAILGHALRMQEFQERPAEAPRRKGLLSWLRRK